MLFFITRGFILKIKHATGFKIFNVAQDYSLLRIIYDSD